MPFSKTCRQLACIAVVALGGWAASPSLQAQSFDEWAASPPLGWNSWDCYGSSVVESEVRANAEYMAKHLKQAGWQYVVVDIRWYVNNPGAHGYREFNKSDFVYNDDGIMLPSPNRFPSATDGTFTQLATDVHDLGLKFGVHMMRGINRRFYDHVDKSETIGDTEHTFGQLRVVRNGAFWLGDNYGLEQNAAAQAWYDLMIGTYAKWGLDYIKVDDLSAPEYRRGEVEMLRHAIDKAYEQTGQKIVLSTSPGPTADIDNDFKLDPTIAKHVQQHANLWRITNDLWDEWHYVEVMFERAHQWTPYRQSGHWPDNDMLPLGHVSIRAHVGRDRQSNLTPDQQQTLMSLWCISQSPLMFGGDLPSNDDFTLSLLNNPETMAVNQQGRNSRQLYRQRGHIAWVADAPDGAKYLALFNIRGGESNLNELMADASFVSPLITKQSPGRSTSIDVPLEGKRHLYLIVDSGDGPGPDPDVYDCDWADWVNMKLEGPGGKSLPLTKLKWTEATSGWQPPAIGTNNEGREPLTIDGRQYADGIGTHAASVIEYELPEGYTKLTGQAGLDDAGVNQSHSTSSVRFAITLREGKSSNQPVEVSLADLGFTGPVEVRDLWQQTDLGQATETFAAPLAPYASGLYRLTQP